MTPKFEYTGSELAERDERFKLMLAWADYYANYQDHADTIRLIGGQVMAAIAKSAVHADQSADVCKEMLYRKVPGMNDHLTDLQTAIEKMQGWHVRWNEPSSNPNEPTASQTGQGWIIGGSVSHVANDMACGSIVRVHVGERRDTAVGQLVDMSKMQEIRFSHP